MYSDNSSDFANGFISGQTSANNGNCNGGFGGWGSEWAWILILFVLFGFWGNNGWNNGNGVGNGGNYIPYAVGSSYTDASIQRGFDQQAVISKLDGINAGLCDGFYATQTGMLNGFNSVNQGLCNLGFNVQNGFNATQVALMQGNNALQSQIASCCCDNRVGQMQIQNAIDSCCCTTNRTLERGFADANYNLATQSCALQTSIANSTRDIIDSQRDGTRAILDYLCQEKISDLQNENQALRLSASQAAQNLAIGARIDAATAEILRKTGAECPMPAYVVQPPQPVTFPTNCCGTVNYAGYGNNGCGCNSGCGC